MIIIADYNVYIRSDKQYYLKFLSGEVYVQSSVTWLLGKQGQPRFQIIKDILY